jgi:hypothetical protein
LQKAYKEQAQENEDNSAPVKFDRFEGNEFEFLSNFIIMNLIFAKNELKLDERSSSILLETLWQILELRDASNDSDCAERSNVSGDCSKRKERKFAIMKDALMMRH